MFVLARRSARAELQRCARLKPNVPATVDLAGPAASEHRRQVQVPVLISP